jgi:hypothetical protein
MQNAKGPGAGRAACTSKPSEGPFEGRRGLARFALPASGKGTPGRTHTKNSKVIAMRHALSLLSGITVALLCVLLLHQASSLSLFALAGCGIGICVLTRTWAYNLPALRRASVRLRIYWRRHARHALPGSTAAGPFVRRQLGRVNPMWLSYALIASWAVYEMLDGTRFLGAAPIERAAAGASTAMDAVAGTSAAIRALSAVGATQQRGERDVGGVMGIAATALPNGPDPGRLLLQADSPPPVMGGAAGEARNASAGCSATSSLRCGCQTMLDAFLPEPPVKEF